MGPIPQLSRKTMISSGAVYLSEQDILVVALSTEDIGL